MKSLRRYFCVLLCCLLLLVGSSVSVSAAELDIGEYSIQESITIDFADGRNQFVSSFNYIPGNGEQETKQYTLNILREYFWNATLLHFYRIYSTSDKVIAYANKQTTVRLDNIYYSQLITDGTTSVYDYTIEGVSIWVYYVNGSTELLKNGTFDGSTSDFSKNLKVTFTPKHDVKSIEIIPYGNLNAELEYFNDEVTQDLTFYMGEFLGDGKTSLVIVQPSEEESLLGGILDSITSGLSSLGQKLGDVWTSITDGFAQMGQKLTDVWNAITSLPQKIWEFIENGLKSLFIPNEESFARIKENFDNLLSSKLGAIYQVGTIIVDFWTDILVADERNKIELPEVEIPIGSEKTFTFGGYSIQIVPDGFGPVAVTSKLITSIVATFLFLNAIKRKYDEFLRT